MLNIFSFFGVSEYHKIHGWRKAKNIHQLLLKVYCWIRSSCEKVRIFTVYSRRKSMRKCVPHCSGPMKGLTSFISIIFLHLNYLPLTLFIYYLVMLTIIQNSSSSVLFFKQYFKLKNSYCKCWNFCIMYHVVFICLAIKKALFSS